MKKKLGRILVSLLSVALCMQLIVPFASPAVSATSGTVTIDPSVRYQTMDGWGTTIAWWGNMVGGWTWDGESGKPLRDELNDLLFSDEGIGLNILRYNIGGGDAPGHNHVERLEGRMQGFASAEGVYDWSRDANQVYSMERAVTNREESRTAKGISSDVITEFFSNSPPYWMTINPCTSGNVSKSDNNISIENMPKFAEYLGDVTRYFAEEKGIVADYLVPLNEASSNYWSPSENGVKQEGCKISAGTYQNALFDALRAQDLPEGTTLSGLDETSTELAISSWNLLSADNKAAFTKYNTHTYSAADDQRQTLYNAISAAGKKLWMSEVCDSAVYGSEGWNPKSMATPLLLSGKILSDLKVMKVNAWVYWQAIENLMECTKGNGNWGLITAAEYEPFGITGNYWQQTNTGNNFSKYNLNWEGNAATDVDVGDYWIGKSYYMLGQYSKFIRQGYTLVGINGSAEVAAISPDGQELVIVATNNNDSSADVRDYVISGAANLSHAEVYRTSGTEDLQRLADINITSGDQFSATLPARSITTFVIKASGRIYAAGNDPVSKTAIDAKIAEVQGTVQGNFTNTDWAAFEESLRVANLVSGEHGANQEDVDSALGNLNNAVVHLVDKTALIAAIATCNTLVQANYSPASWSNLTGFHSAAIAVNANADATQAEIDTAAANLTTAINALTVDKTALNSRIAALENTANNNYTADSWSAFQSALDSAQTTAAGTSTQLQVNNAILALNSAYSKLIIDGVSKDALAATIATCDALTQTDWSTASWNNMKSFHTAAKTVNANINATQDEINTANTNLVNAFNALAANKTALQNAIATADALTQADWTPASWGNMKSLYNAAAGVNADNNAAPAQVSTATANLLTAINTLVTDRTVLTNAIAAGDALTQSDWSPSSWSSMKGFYNAAVTMNANATATPAQVKTAAAKLMTAIDNLKVDQTALAAQIAACAAKNEADWSAASWSNMMSFYNAAVAVNKNVNAKQNEVNTAAANLTTAANALKVDKTLLAATIASYGSLTQSDWSTASWNSMKGFYNAAVAVNGKSNAKQSEVNTANTNLKNAIAALAVDKTALNSKSNAVKDTLPSNYTNATWNTFQSALGNAQTTAANKNAKQAQVDAALAALNSAHSGLARTGQVNKTGLNAKIDAVKNTAKGDYTNASWNTFQGALSSAFSVTNSAGATQAQVDAAHLALNNAYSGLAFNPANKTALGAKINAVKNTAKGNYTDASWNTFQSALTSAQSVAANASAAQAQVDAALAALNSAHSGLKLKVTVNKTALNNRINAVKNTAKGNYTDATWNAFQSMLSSAQSTAANTSATQAQVDAALVSLNAAFAGLKLNQQKPQAVSSTNVTLGYRASQTLQVKGEGITWSGGNNYVSVNAKTGEITSLKSFGKSGTAVITASNAVGDVKFNVKVQPSAVQWLMIVIFFGWIWM